MSRQKFVFKRKKCQFGILKEVYRNKFKNIQMLKSTLFIKHLLIIHIVLSAMDTGVKAESALLP